HLQSSGKFMKSTLTVGALLAIVLNVALAATDLPEWMAPLSWGLAGAVAVVGLAKRYLSRGTRQTKARRIGRFGILGVLTVAVSAFAVSRTWPEQRLGMLTADERDRFVAVL